MKNAINRIMLLNRIIFVKYTSWFTFILLFQITAKAQEVINLYPDGVPNSKISAIREKYDAGTGIFRDVTNPTLEIFLPEKSTASGAAVIICPGGGYKVVVYEAEGVKTAKEFAKNGVAAFVLKYRIPDDSTMIDKKIGPLQDAQQALKVVRDKAYEWGIDINKVGIMGFSAGGHLASAAATHFNNILIENSSNINVRPDFLILIYPVTSMLDSLTHHDSKVNLLGNNPSEETVNNFSNELNVNDKTPPAFLIHAGDDTVVDVDNTIVFYEKLRHNKVPAEMHIYPSGGHGFVLAQPTAEWMKPLFKWMKTNNWIKK